MAVCLCSPGQAGLLISAQGNINDVSMVATIHHTERPRNAFLPGEPWHVVSRERSLLMECVRLCVSVVQGGSHHVFLLSFFLIYLILMSY